MLADLVADNCLIFLVFLVIVFLIVTLISKTFIRRILNKISAPNQLIVKVFVLIITIMIFQI